MCSNIRNFRFMVQRGRSIHDRLGIGSREHLARWSSLERFGEEVGARREDIRAHVELQVLRAAELGSGVDGNFTLIGAPWTTLCCNIFFSSASHGWPYSSCIRRYRSNSSCS